MNQKVLPDGPWDEMTAWFSPIRYEHGDHLSVQAGRTFSMGSPRLWASMHTARLTSRPVHADQLHVALWQDGENIIQDAGTYRYTAPRPWDNRLARSAYHNTMTIDDKEPMLWAGRFLWLDWDQVRLDNSLKNRLGAFHSGYEKHGFVCKREISFCASNQFEVTDIIESVNEDRSHHLLRLHWLLPDWEWKMEEPNLLDLADPKSPRQVQVELSINPVSLLHNQQVQIVRAGKVYLGEEDALSPTLGWISPTYNKLMPALSFRLSFNSGVPVSVTSRFTFSPN
jgi:hypothetical protein